MILAIVVLCVVTTFIPHGDCGVIQANEEDTVTETIRGKCHSANVYDNQIIDNFLTAAHTASVCIANSRDNTGSSYTLIDFEESCSFTSRSNYYKCLSDFFDVAKVCFTKNEQYIPDLILNGVNNTKNNLCNPENKQKLDEIKTKIQSYTDNQFLNSEQAMQNCMSKPELFINYVPLTKFIILKEDLCSDFQKVYDCYLQSITGDTSNDYSELVDVYLGAYLEGCK